MFFKKKFFKKISQKFIGKRLCHNLFFNKVAGLNFIIKKRPGAGVFLWILRIFKKHLFLQNTCGGCFCLKLSIQLSIKVSIALCGRVLASCDHIWQWSWPLLELHRKFLFLMFLTNKYHKYLASLIEVCISPQYPNLKKESSDQRNLQDFPLVNDITLWPVCITGAKLNFVVDDSFRLQKP